MSTTTFHHLLDLHCGRIIHAALYFLHDENRAYNVAFYTFSVIKDQNIEDEEIIFLIAKDELLNEFHNLALTFKPMTMTQKIFKRGIGIAQKFHTWRFKLLQKEIEIEFGHAPLWVIAGVLVACCITVYLIGWIVSYLIGK